MARIGVYEAKTHLPRLLERVERGEVFTITRHGRPIAVLSPAPGGSGLTTDEAIAALRDFRGKHSLGGVTVRELIDEGRRR